MKSLWQTDTGHLACRWSDLTDPAAYHPRWFEDTSGAHGSYLPPPPDFASRSPFAGQSWFQPPTPQRPCD